MKRTHNIKLLICLLMVINTVWALAQMQTIKGYFPQAKGKEMRLLGYEGFAEKELAKTPCDSMGYFTLQYPTSYIGAALLQVKESSSVIVLLNHENFRMQWNDLQDLKTLSFVHSPENDSFAKGFSINRDADQRLVGLKYLLPLYEKDPKKYQWLKREINGQQQLFGQFIGRLPANGYVSYYLKIRKLMSDMFSAINNRNKAALPECEASLAKIDFADDRLWHSGLAVDLFTGFYQLMDGYENADTIGGRANRATDTWVKSLETNPVRRQDVAEFCFKLLEKRNLTAASEYLAKAMLGQSGCQLDEKRTSLFEQYRKMAVGNTAPDILLENGTKLSGLNHAYNLVVFGASWCPNCRTDYPSLVGRYKAMHEKYDIEFVYISLDGDKKSFGEFYKEAPFITNCDTKSWNGETVKNYCVVATPSYFLVNRDLKIIAKPRNPEQLEAILNMLK